LACSELVKKDLPSNGVLLLTFDVNKIYIVAYVSEDKSSQVNATEWVKAALDAVGGVLADGATATLAHGHVDGDPTKDRYPIKLKDQAKSAGFAYLKSKGAIEEESDDDVAVAESSPRLIAKTAAPIGISISPAAADNDLLPDNLPALAPTTSRSSTAAGRSRRESFSMRRMQSPVGMGEGLASGRLRRYSTDLGTTMSGHGAGGTSYH